MVKTLYLHFWNTAKTVLRRKCTALNAFLHKKGRSEVKTKSTSPSQEVRKLVNRTQNISRLDYYSVVKK